MLMLLSLCMALVGAESGAEEEEGAGFQDETLGRSWHQKSKVEEEAAAICRSGGWKGEGPLESLSQVPLRRERGGTGEHDHKQVILSL